MNFIIFNLYNKALFINEIKNKNFSLKIFFILRILTFKF